MGGAEVRQSSSRITHAVAVEIVAEGIGAFCGKSHVCEHALELLRELEAPGHQHDSARAAHISTLSLATMPFSASSLALRAYKRRLARWFL